MSQPIEKKQLPKGRWSRITSALVVNSVYALPLLFGPLIARIPPSSLPEISLHLKRFITLMAVVALWGLVLRFVGAFSQQLTGAVGTQRRSFITTKIALSLIALMLMLGSARIYFGESGFLLILADLSLTFVAFRLVALKRPPGHALLGLGAQIGAHTIRAMVSALAVAIPLSLPGFVSAAAFAVAVGAVTAQQLRSPSAITAESSDEDRYLARIAWLFLWASPAFVSLLIYRTSLPGGYFVCFAPVLITTRFFRSFTTSAPPLTHTALLSISFAALFSALKLLE